MKRFLRRQLRELIRFLMRILIILSSDLKGRMIGINMDAVQYANLNRDLNDGLNFIVFQIIVEGKIKTNISTTAYICSPKILDKDGKEIIAT